MATSMSTVFGINNRISILEVHEWSIFSAVFSCLPLSFMYTAETLHMTQSLLDLGKLPSLLHSVEAAHGVRQHHSTTFEQCSNCLARIPPLHAEGIRRGKLICNVRVVHATTVRGYVHSTQLAPQCTAIRPLGRHHGLTCK